MAIQQMFFGGGPPAGGDPLWSQVTSLTHFDGTNGATIFPDERSFSWTPDTTSGAVTISTAQAMFGPSSLFFAIGGAYLSTASSGKFDFGSGAFTIECWVRPTPGYYGAYPNIFSTRGPSNSGVTLRIEAGGHLEFFWGDGNAAFTGSGTVATNAWSHVALTRASNTIRLFLNGVLQGSVSQSGSITTNQASLGYIGVDGAASASEFYRGYIDEFRVTKGTARYTANFTPPTAPFVSF